MSGCSLTEAFPDVTEKSGKVARKEERKKAKSCGGPASSVLGRQGPASSVLGRQGPALSFLKAEDPDRFAEKPDDAPAAMKKESFECQGDDSASLIGQHVKDVIGEKSRNTLPKASPTPTEKVPSYFGKSDSFADFNPALNDNPGYQIQGAGFGSFDKKGLEKVTGTRLPTPVLNDAWKPLTPSGAQTSFFDAKYTTTVPHDDSFSKSEKEALLHKLDVLFARLDDLEHKKNEYAHTEISLFILSGLFLLFGLETVRKFK